MCQRLVELVKDRNEDLFPTRTASQARTWKELANAFNVEFPEAVKTTEQLKIKWKNLKQKAKPEAQLLYLIV